MTTLNELKGTFALDPAHTEIGFVTRHAMITKVRGSFSEFEGTATVDGADPESSSLEVTIQAASLNTRQADRDAHVRSADFLDVEQYPTITFKATDFAVDGETVAVTGDLTVHGVTKPVTIPFELTGTAVDPWGNTRVGFEGSLAVNRKDWGITWNAALEAGGILVSEKVTLEFELSAVKTA